MVDIVDVVVSSDVVRSVNTALDIQTQVNIYRLSSFNTHYNMSVNYVLISIISCQRARTDVLKQKLPKCKLNIIK